MILNLKFKHFKIENQGLFEKVFATDLANQAALNKVNFMLFNWNKIDTVSTLTPDISKSSSNYSNTSKFKYKEIN